MAKKQPKVSIVTKDVWQYEFILREQGQLDEVLWITEDDERSASYKALTAGATGNIRVRAETVRVVKHEDDVLVEATDWVVKVQDLLPKK